MKVRASLINWKFNTIVLNLFSPEHTTNGIYVIRARKLEMGWKTFIVLVGIMTFDHSLGRYKKTILLECTN